MKSSLALLMEQLLRLDPFLELHFEVILSTADFSLFPLLLSVTAPTAGVAAMLAEVVPTMVAVAAEVVAAGGPLIVSGVRPRGGEVCLGVKSELNGTSGITRSSSFGTNCLLTTKAPTLIVSLNDFDTSSLKQNIL